MKKNVLGLFLLASALVLLQMSSPARATDEAPKMSKEELKGRLGNPDTIVVDVRAGWTWDGSDLKIKGAVREDPGNVDSWIDTFPRDKTLVFYCS